MSGITVERDAHSQQFVTIHNRVARDKRLSYRARGLLLALLSYPSGQRVTADTLADGGSEGRLAVLGALKELERSGYITRTRKQDERGRWSTRMIVRETAS